MDITECFYCKTDMKPGASVCAGCGAYAEETKDEVLWFRAGDSQGKRVLRGAFPWLFVAALVVGVFVFLERTDDKSERKADELVECIMAGRDDC